MLILSRKSNEVLVINHNIRVTVVQVRGNKVRLGVEAPAEVPVHRLEVEEAIARDGGARADGARVDNEKDDAGPAECLPPGADATETPATEMTVAELSHQPPDGYRRPKHNRIIEALRQERDELLAERDGLAVECERLTAELAELKVQGRPEIQS